MLHLVMKITNFRLTFLNIIMSNLILCPMCDVKYPPGSQRMHEEGKKHLKILLGNKKHFI